jgi:hypothetical protein
MTMIRKFNAVIQNAGGGGAFVNVPFDVEKIYGKKRVKIKATFEGVPYRGSLVRMGSPCHMLPILKEIRAKIGRDFGDEIAVTIEEDLEERTVEIPADVEKALKRNKAARARYEALSYTHRREYIRWITDAKREETRNARIAKMIEKLTV